MQSVVKVLLVEDNPGDARLIEKLIGREAETFSCALQRAKRLGEALQLLEADAYDAVLLDLALPDSHGTETLRRLLTHTPDVPVVVLTGLDDAATGMQAVKEGAQDYLVKGQVSSNALCRTLRYAVERARYQQQMAEARLQANAAEVRAAEAEKARAALEEEVAERKQAQQEVQALNEQLKQRVDRLAALHQIDQTINASIELNITLQVVVQQVVQQLEVDAVAVLLFNEQNLTLTHAVSYGFQGEAIRQTSYGLGQGYSGRAALMHQPITIQDITQEVTDAASQQFMVDEGFSSYHATPLVAKGHLLGVLEVYHRQPFSFTEDWLGFCDALAAQTAIAVDNAALFERLQRSNNELTLAYDTTIEGWARALDLKDHETEGHSRRVTELTVELARRMGMDEAELVHVRRGALLHDIGKMGVPDAILLKPGKLTDEEWSIMKRHTSYAHDFLAPVPFLKPALDIPYCHHEKWDGSGYPRGLEGKEIPLAARIFAVVDVYDALSSDRPYRQAWPQERVLSFIQEQSGTHFDPAVVTAFLRMMNAVLAVTEASSANERAMCS